MSDTLTNTELRREYLPRPGDHGALAKFAHKIDGYAVAGGLDECARLARAVRLQYEDSGRLSHSLTDLRVSLFYLHRSWRFDFLPPSDGDYAYAEALLGGIRDHLERRDRASGGSMRGQGSTADLRYLFGRPVSPSKPSANGPRDIFVLGAYPSALHVAWHRQPRKSIMRAVAVDNEPEPFWNGHNEAELVREWRADVSFRGEWGEARPCERLNGSSGRWLDREVLIPLGAGRDSAWISDCLDLYHQSKSAETKIRSNEVSGIISALGIVPPNHLGHPTEDQIVSRALKNERERLLRELTTAHPAVVVTLGNAALRVLIGLSEERDKSDMRLSADNSYGEVVRIRIADIDLEWRPLAHPAAPARYQAAHAKWIQGLQGR